MTSAPDDSDLGPREAVVRLMPGVDLSKIKLSAVEGFVYSRIDGRSSVATLCMLTGLGEAATLGALRELRSKGLILVGDDRPRRATSEQRAVIVPRRTDARSQPSAEETALQELVAGEQGIDLKPEMRLQIRLVHARLEHINLFELLGVGLDADEKEIRKGYFAQSKIYHPDRYYNKTLGPYKELLQTVFKQISAGYKFLCNDQQRADYRQMLVQQLEQEQQIQAVEQQAVEAELEECEATERSGSPEAAERARQLRAEHARSLLKHLRPAARTPSTAAVPILTEEQLRPRARRDSQVTVALRGRRGQQFLQQGLQQMEKGQYLAAAASLKLAMTYNPEDKETARVYQQALARSREQTAESLLRRSAVDESVGRLDAALRHALQAAEHCPKPQYLRRAAQCLLLNQDLPKARDYATKAAQSDPNSADIRVTLARVYSAAGMESEARRELQQALKLDPQHAEALGLLKRVKTT